jgi:hypothetical protein
MSAAWQPAVKIPWTQPTCWADVAVQTRHAGQLPLDLPPSLAYALACAVEAARALPVTTVLWTRLAILAKEALFAVVAVALAAPSVVAIALARATQAIVASAFSALAAGLACFAEVAVHAPDTIVRVGPSWIADAASVSVEARVAAAVWCANGTRKAVLAKVLRSALAAHRHGVEVPAFVAQRTPRLGGVAFVANARSIAINRVVAPAVVVAGTTLCARLAVVTLGALHTARLRCKAFGADALSVSI